MSTEGLQFASAKIRRPLPEGFRARTSSSYEQELARHIRNENRLSLLLAGEKALSDQKDELIQQQDVQNKEASHRLLNGLQMVASVLSLQSRCVDNPDTSSQLAVAANRVAMIERVHRRLHGFDGADILPLKRFLQDLCRDFSMMVSSDEQPENIITVSGPDIELPTTKGIPIGFIVSELLMNAAKYGRGGIAVILDSNEGHGYRVSVSNEGLALSDTFDPAASKGLGMRIIRSLVQRIGGTLEFGRLQTGKGTCFTVRFF